MIKAYNERTNENHEVEASTVKELAKKLNISLNEFLVIINNEIAIEDSKLKDKDEVKFLSVISGG
jgi:sulfur carrier protein ThiS